MKRLSYFFSSTTLVFLPSLVQRKIKNTKAANISLLESFFSSLVVGFAETYFVAFAIHLGCTTLESGLLASFPLFIAIAYKFYDVSTKNQPVISRWMLKSVLIQTISLAMLAVLSLIQPKQYTFGVLFVLYSIYWVGHYRIQPAWNRWVSEIVHIKDSQKFFSKRTHLAQIGTIIGLFLGGFALNLHAFEVSEKYLFLGLFFASAGFKGITYYLYKQIPCPKITVKTSTEKMWSFFKKHGDFFRSYGVFNLSLYLSAPFVAGYLLTKRGLSYETFMWVTLGAMVGKILASQVLSNYKKTFTPHQLLFYGALVASPLPALWPLCQSMTSMFLLNLLSGVGWACWEIGISLSFFKNVRSNDKIEAVSVYNSIGIATQVIGAGLGALLVKYGFDRNYDVLFVVSGLVRFLCAFGLRKRPLGGDVEKVIDVDQSQKVHVKKAG